MEYELYFLLNLMGISVVFLIISYHFLVTQETPKKN